MLSPEVWNFKAPDSLFTSDIIDSHKCHRKIKSFEYNHLVSVILPDTLNIPNELIQVFSNVSYYKITDLNIAEFLNENFINNFVKKGKLSGLSVNTRIDFDNCLSISESGQIILSLDKISYQSLGLKGQLSRYHTSTKDRYIAKIDLTSDNLKSDKPNYKKMVLALEKLDSKTMILSWEPPDDNICPSSLAKYFFDLGYVTESCKTKCDSHLNYSGKVPLQFGEDNAFDFVEWLGIISLQCQLNDEYLSLYTTPEPSLNLEQVKIIKWRGYLTCTQIGRLFDILQKFQKNFSKKWVAMYVQGFSDAVVSWGQEENHYYTNGDNGYVLVFDDQRCLFCCQNNGRKKYRHKLGN